MTLGRHIRYITAAVPLLLAACSAVVSPPPCPPPPTPKPAAAKLRAEVSTISLEDFFQLQESGKAVIIDARPSFVYAFGHVPGAINMPKNHCEEMIAKREAGFRSAIHAGKKIIVYCTGPNCPDSRTVADHLALSGISSSVFPGGWDEWKEAGMTSE
jgi:rhodanese-related sulfurtransferase